MVSGALGLNTTLDLLTYNCGNFVDDTLGSLKRIGIDLLENVQDAWWETFLKTIGITGRLPSPHVSRIKTQSTRR